MSLPQIQTRRLTLRPFEPPDADAARRYMADPQVMRFIPSGALDEAQVRAFVEQQCGPEAQALAVVRNVGPQLIGHLSWHPWFAPETYEIGWVFGADAQGQGYATEAARALVDYGFATLRLHRIVATCQPENPPSYRVMEKLGMRREGHFRQCIHRGGDVWWDELFYAILRAEWEERAAPGA